MITRVRNKGRDLQRYLRNDDLKGGSVEFLVETKPEAVIGVAFIAMAIYFFFSHGSTQLNPVIVCVVLSSLFCTDHNLVRVRSSFFSNSDGFVPQYRYTRV